MRKIRKVIVHNSVSSFGDASIIDEWHKARGWRGIGYHYVICNGHKHKYDKYESALKDGEIQEGRDIEITGAHCKGMNSSSVGICLIGLNGVFTEKQFISLTQLVKGLLVEFDLKPEDILGHYETPSGKKQGKTCPEFDMTVFRSTLSESN
jgi:hypothetical protein